MIKKILILKIFIHVTSPLGRGAWKTSFYKPDTIPNSIKLLEVIYQVVHKLKQGSRRLQTPSPVLPSGELLKHVIFLSLYTQGHCVQTWCHKYSTRPLRPSRPWLQEVVPSVCCLQWVFLRAKTEAACEPRCLSLAATSSSQLAYVQIWHHP